MERYIVKFKIIFVLLLSFTIISCDKEDGGETCDAFVACYTEKPNELYVELSVSENPTSDSVRVRLFKGEMDDGELFDDYYTTNEQETYLLPVNQVYTATAEYVKTNNDTILVVASEKLVRKYCTDGDYKCYDWEKTMSLDLTLK